MNVSLTERCYLILAQENPIASDLRLVVSVVRVIGELERIGDLALRVVKLWPDLPMMRVAGLSIAFHPKPAVRELAMVSIMEGGMDRALEVLKT